MGVIPIYRDSAADSTAISNIFIDEYLKDANDAQIKIYLYLVRMMSVGLPTSIGEMADQFNHTEKDVVRALRYWEARGLLVLQSNSAGDITGIRLCSLQRRCAATEEARVISIEPLLSGASGNVGDDVPSADPNAAAGEQESGSSIREESRQLLLIVEQYIGKPLSPAEIRTIYYLSDELHFSDELIDYLVEYCVGLGKKDFRYIEKVALNWAEQGISTASAARQQTALSRSRRRSGGKKSPVKNSFNQIEQNSYDFTALEEKLLKQ